jgi:hypothetical protein
MSIFHRIQFKSTLGEKLMKRNARTLLPFFLLFMFLWIAPGIAHANTVTVNCSPTKGKPQTITAALASLPLTEHNTLQILGTCNENVTITTIDHLTLTGSPTTILNPLDPNSATITILDSQDVTLNNLLINGGTGGDGVDCQEESLCRLNNVTIQNAGGTGLAGGSGSLLFLTDCQIQNNGSDGIFLGENTHLVLAGGTIQGNGVNGGGNGITINTAATAHLASDAANLGPTIQNNLGNGISSFHGSLHIPGGTNSTISGNSADGVALEGASTGVLVGVNIINNLGHGVRIGDLSFALFKGFGTISGNNSPNVVCDPVYSAVRGVQHETNDTNCPADLPTAP